MQTITINPSIAATVNINSVGFAEMANIYFEGQIPWLGTFEFNVWNSAQKNTSIDVPGAITPSGDLLTLKIDPTNQNLPAAKYYYEIFSIAAKRVIFKGEIVITK